MNRIGFMQGRLSPIVNGKIQAFPWTHWREEFSIASRLEVFLMEWTLDQENLYKNPLMTLEGQLEVLELCKKYHLSIPSLTGDCFMQAPFFKNGEDLNERIKDYTNIVKACGKLGIKYIIFPLVDNSSVKTEAEEKCLVGELVGRVDLLKENNVKIVFESDFSPKELKVFISKFPNEYFGINYDIGNSASLGFDPSVEFAEYGERILNIHVKDRKLGGTTVPLGEGNANFELVFNEIKKINYSGNFILQTARSPHEEHEAFIRKFSTFVFNKIKTWN